MPQKKFLTVQEMAKMHRINPVIVYRILQTEKDKPAKQQLIPGAFKLARRARGEWQIPIKSAEAFVPRSKGRPRVRPIKVKKQP
jgi:hypothetical protein